MALTLSWGCVQQPDQAQSAKATVRSNGTAGKPSPVVSPPLPDGSFEVQSVTYDDITNAYQLFLLNAPNGRPPLYQTSDLRMARIDEAGLHAGKKTYLQSEGGTTTLFLTPEFSISYTHNVTEDHVNQQTGQPEVVIVRQESSAWSPFMSGLAGAAIGNALFAPRYYYPPPYNPGFMHGYGGAGITLNVASEQFTQRYGREPPAAHWSHTGIAPRRLDVENIRPTGQGAGASRFSRSPNPMRKTGSSLRSFGSARRRR